MTNFCFCSISTWLPVNCRHNINIEHIWCKRIFIKDLFNRYGNHDIKWFIIIVNQIISVLKYRNSIKIYFLCVVRLNNGIWKRTLDHYNVEMYVFPLCIEWKIEGQKMEYWELVALFVYFLENNFLLDHGVGILFNACYRKTP